MLEIFPLCAEKKNNFFWCVDDYGFCVHKVYVLNTLCTTTFYGTTFQGRAENSITSTVESRPHTTAAQEAAKLRSWRKAWKIFLLTKAGSKRGTTWLWGTENMFVNIRELPPDKRCRCNETPEFLLFAFNRGGLFWRKNQRCFISITTGVWWRGRHGTNRQT